MNPWIIIFWLFTLVVAGAAGWNVRGDHESAKQLQLVEAAQKKTQAVQREVDRQGDQQAASAAASVVSDREITKEVIRYVQVTKPADRCDLPGTWRVRHDASASGKPAEPAGLAEGIAAPVTDAAALETVSENYADCRHYAAQVVGWNDFWQSVKGLCRNE